MTYLGHLTFYPYAIFLSAILLLFLTAFLLFDKRIKAGFYMCLILSALFVLNQALTIYFLVMRPAEILPLNVLENLAEEAVLFPVTVSSMLLLWGLFLFFSTWKSKPVFKEELKQEELSWLVQLRQKRVPPAKIGKSVLKEKN